MKYFCGRNIRKFCSCFEISNNRRFYCNNARKPILQCALLTSLWRPNLCRVVILWTLLAHFKRTLGLTSFKNQDALTLLDRFPTISPAIFQRGYIYGEVDLVDGLPVGGVRASLGYMSTKKDVQRFLNFLRTVFVSS